MSIRGVSAIKNIGYMYVAQMAQMLLSVLMSIYVPMLIGLREFSYWQLFIFYSSYVGLLHLGLNDGIYLTIGGTKLKDDDKIAVSNQLWMSIILQCLVLSVLFGILVGLNLERERLVVFGYVLTYAIVSNVFNFCGSTLQALNILRLYSLAVVADKLFVILSIAFLSLWGVHEFQYFVTSYIIGKAIAMLILLFRNKDLFLRHLYFRIQTWRLMRENVRIGCNLMFANLASTFIIGVGRFFVDLRFPIEQFGLVSFAFTLIGFVLVLLSQVGASVFPILKTKDEAFLVQIYPKLNVVLTILLPLSFLLYPFLVALVEHFLEQYTESLQYMLFLLPMCIFDAKNVMLYNTYMKVLRCERALLYINLIALCFSTLFSFLAVFILHNLSLLVIGLTLSIVLKSSILHLYLCRQLQLPWQTTFKTADIVVSIILVVYLSLTSESLNWVIFLICGGFVLYYYRVLKINLLDLFLRKS